MFEGEQFQYNNLTTQRIDDKVKQTQRASLITSVYDNSRYC